MENWKIRQAVDLARSGCGPAAWPEALMVVGDKQAHTWEVVFTDGGAVPNLTGASVTAYFNRPDNETVVCVGSAEGNTVRVTLGDACYAFEGPLVGILRVTQGAVTFTASIMRFTVAHGANSVIVDPGDVVPDLTELLAQIAYMEHATADADAAAARANTSAADADAAAQSIGAQLTARLGNLAFMLAADGGIDVTIINE